MNIHYMYITYFLELVLHQGIVYNIYNYGRKIYVHEENKIILVCRSTLLSSICRHAYVSEAAWIHGTSSN